MKRVVMLVNNDWKIDSRVTREARSVAADGYEVHVISRSDVPAYAKVESQGVTFHSVPSSHRGTFFARSLSLIRLHTGVVDSLAVTADYNAIVRQLIVAALKAIAAAIALIALSPVLIPLVFFLLLTRHFYKSEELRRRFARFTPRTGVKMFRMTINLIRRSAQFGARALSWKVGNVHFAINREYLTYLNDYGTNVFDLANALRPEIVHAHDLVTLSTGYALAKKLSCVLIYDAHELETHTNYWGLSAETKKWIEIYERVLIHKTRAVITVCDSIADWLKEHYAIPRPTVILNSPDLDIESMDAVPNATLRDVLNLASDTPLAVYVGSVTIDRGLVQCVRATALIADLHFAFVGPRYSVTEKEIKDEATTLGISDRIHLVDPVPSRQVARFVAVADCSVIAIQNVCLSYYFCFPNKLLESSITGVPVAVARLIELERFVGKYGVGVVMDETDPAAIAAAIRKILADPGSYKPSAETLREIRTTFGWPTQQRRLGELYRTLGRNA